MKYKYVLLKLVNLLYHKRNRMFFPFLLASSMPSTLSQALQDGYKVD